MLRVRIEGAEEYTKALDHINIAEHPDIFAPVFKRWAFEGVSIAQEQYLSGPSSEEWYGKGSKRTPPKPPSLTLGAISGALRGSIGVSFGGPNLAVFGTPSDYAATHEFGDEGRGIPARPFILPAAQKAYVGVPAALLKAWKARLR